MAEPTVAAPATSEAAPETTTDASLLNQGDKTAPDKPADATTETKPEGQDKKADEQTDNKTDAKPPDVPEKYELRLPENTIIDQPLMEEFTAWAKELKLSNDQAQAAADLHLKVLGTFAQQQAQEFVAQQRQWQKEFGDDPEIGGAKADETLTLARKGLAALGATDRLKQEFDRTGLGNHPDMIRIWANIGKFVGDDGVIMGKQPDQDVQDMASKWYAKTTPTT